MTSVRAAVALLLLVFCVVDLTAQKERVLPRRGTSSLEGTSFVLGFMQNEVLEIGADSKLSLFVSSEFDATVTIDFPDGTRLIQTLVAHSVRVVPISVYYEVNPSEMMQRKAIFVTSNLPIIVYAMNTKMRTTDTYTAIPIPYLGTEYYSVNRPNDYYEPGKPDIEIDLLPRSGQFMVIATDNNTSVTITPACATLGGIPAGNPFTVVLQRGQCYLVRAAPGTLGTNDLTGSRIQTTKPVALLSGHVRSSIPTLQKASKDHLIEMLPPIDRWGTEYITSPFALVEGGDYVRMVASEANTVVEITDNTGTRNVTLQDAGSWLEVYVESQAYWRSDKKFLLVQFMPSSNGNPNAQFGYADYDPAMVVVPALSQYVTGALFQFPILESQNPPQPRYYFINLIADEMAIPSLRINNVAVSTLAPGILTSSVPGTSYRWAQVQLTDGVHSIACDSGSFSGVMYGTSSVDSYANLFGLRWGPKPKLDISPPVYDMKVDCGTVTGSITDVSNDTAAIDEIVIQTPPTKNFYTALFPVGDSIGSSTVEATVKDMWKDATLVFHTYDTQGNGREWVYEYDAPNVLLPLNISIPVLGPQQSCTTFWLVNADTTPVTVRRVSLQGDARFTLEREYPVDTLISAGDSLKITVCFMPNADTLLRTAKIVVEFPCGLRKDIIVRTVTNFSISGSYHDFGPVRIGDTACGRVYVVNDGVDSVTVDSVILNRIRFQFKPNIAALALPRKIGPKDTMWIDVCFIPDSVGTYSREDIAGTREKASAAIGYSGRGIRPEVPDIVINWGKRRIGTSHDTTFQVHNVGEAPCIVKRLAASGDTAVFDYGAFGAAPISLGNEGFSLETVTFSPEVVGPYFTEIPLIVDWSKHKTVSVRFIGEGTIPELETWDVDMGRVLVGTRRDTNALVAFAGGTENLTVSNVTVQGADQGAFALADNLTGLRGMALGSGLSSGLTFLPQRIGYHEVIVAVEHDAMPGLLKDTSYIKIFGEGYIPDTSDFAPSLLVAAVLDACVDTSASIVLENRGNTDFVVYRVDVFADDVPVYSDPATPYVILAHQTQQLRVPFTPDRTSAGRLRAVITFADQTVELQAQYTVRIPAYDIVATPFVGSKPGSTVDLQTSVANAAQQDVPVMLAGSYTIPADRLDVQLGTTITATVDDVIGASRLLPVTLVREAPSQYSWSLGGPVQSPFQVRWTVSANSLWKNHTDFVVEVNVDNNQCANGDTSQTSVSNELCAGIIRAVNLAGLVSVSVKVAPNPVEDDLSIEADASAETEISLYLVAPTGERKVLAERIRLIKGIQHVKFSRSQWASGLYWLVLQHGNAEAGHPVMLVK